jgi:hypothetical protein
MRRSEVDTSSLELLLDTITNTFGGILFVLILVILLLRMGENAAQSRFAATDDQKTQELRGKLHDRQSELQSLRQVAASQQAALTSLAQGDAKEFQARLAAIRLRVADLASQKAEHLARIDQMSSELRGAQATESRIRIRIEEETARQQELERDIAVETQIRTRTAELPSVRSTSKREFPVIVRFGRLYSPYSVDKISGERLRQLGDFAILGEIDDALRITPKPYRGTLLEDTPACTAALQRLLNSVDKESFYVAVAVWDDSFSEFAVLKNVMVGHEIEYRLLPTVSGEHIQEGPTHGAYVQ